MLLSRSLCIAMLLCLTAALSSHAATMKCNLLTIASDTTVHAELYRDMSSVSDNARIDYIDLQVHQQYFVDADAKIAIGNLRSARNALKKGLEYYKIEGHGAMSESRPDLKNAITRLKRLESSLSNGDKLDTSSVDSIFADANLTLAKSHILRAKQDWTDLDSTTAGHELKAAVRELDFALLWQKQMLNNELGNKLLPAVKIAEKLVDGVTCDSIEVANQLTSIFGVIEQTESEIYDPK